MIKPKQRITVVRPKENQNPQYLSIEVADREAKDAVNALKDEPFTIGDSVFFRDTPIDDKSMTGRIIVNRCFDVEEVAQFIENLVPQGE